MYRLNIEEGNMKVVLKDDPASQGIKDLKFKRIEASDEESSKTIVKKLTPGKILDELAKEKSSQCKNFIKSYILKNIFESYISKEILSEQHCLR